MLYAIITKHAGMMELADMQDLGSCARACRFDPCYPHHHRRRFITLAAVFYYEIEK